mmetsp:Transcript_138926/g.245507  ORF Transcript_138926/g.245507 Transcript_138926/m.245507 type:complete len:210 (+) Transcript_138926:65-694(+)
MSIVSQRSDHRSVHVTGGSLLEVPAGYEGVVQRTLGGETLLWVHLQQGLGEGLCINSDVAPSRSLHYVTTSSDVRHLLILRAREWHVAREEYKDDHPQAPLVALLCVAHVQDLRSSVCQSTMDFPAQLCFLVAHLAKSEVNELQMRALLRVIHEVLKLQIAMDHVMAMDVVQGQEHLPNGVGSLGLREALSLTHALQQLTPIHAFHHQV